ncbi:unnamed protein product [Dibothriocephalus latus]|uniref:Fibronectin type-III domain-containing protein n=1 Tax=Dibothriocephalus latus TaxID=60516 RepID=A0A3P7MP85_DIBLA|nr:unnamed protein product [Dibothriocephalus latus]
MPIVPKDFTASILGCTTVRLTWKAPNISQPWGRQYLLTVSSRTFTKSYKLQKTEDTINNLVPASTYNFTLQALDKNGRPFRAGALIPVQMPACAVPVPRDLTASAVSPTTIRVTWKPPTDSGVIGDKYQVTVRNDTYQDKVMVTKPEFILPKANPNSVYNFTVSATDRSGKPFPAAASISVKMKVSRKFPLSSMTYPMFANK